MAGEVLRGSEVFAGSWLGVGYGVYEGRVWPCQVFFKELGILDVLKSAV